MKCFEPEIEVYVGSKQQLGCGAPIDTYMPMDIPRYIYAHTHKHTLHMQSRDQSSPVLDMYLSNHSFTSSWCWVWSWPCSCLMPAVFLKPQVASSLKEVVWWNPVTFSMSSFFSCCPFANLSQASNTYNRNNKSCKYYTDRFQARDSPCRQQHSPFHWIGIGRATATAGNCHNDRGTDLSQLRPHGEKCVHFLIS